MDKSADRSVPLWRRPIRTGGGLEVAGAAFGAFQDPLYRQHAASEKASAELGQREALSKALASGDPGEYMRQLAPIYPKLAAAQMGNEIAAQSAAERQRVRDERLRGWRQEEQALSREHAEKTAKIRAGRGNLQLKTMKNSDGSQYAVLFNPKTGQSFDPNTLNPVKVRTSELQAGTASQQQQVDADGNAIPQTTTDPKYGLSGGHELMGVAKKKYQQKLGELRAKWEAASPEKKQIAFQGYRKMQGDIAGAKDNVASIAELVKPGVLPETAVGMVAPLFQLLGGTKASDVQSELDTLKAFMGFKYIEEMRKASPTGGALGQVTEKEIMFLQNAKSNLSLRQSPQQFRKNLAKTWRILKKMDAHSKHDFEHVYGYSPEEHQERTRAQAEGRPAEVKSNVRRWNPETGKLE
jgi:hypothetical protein